MPSAYFFSTLSIPSILLIPSMPPSLRPYLQVSLECTPSKPQNSLYESELFPLTLQMLLLTSTLLIYSIPDLVRMDHSSITALSTFRHHPHSIWKSLGITTMLHSSNIIELITRNYWFPGINAFTKDYINSCCSCQQRKAPRPLRHGELASLLIFDALWKGLSCDFITDLSVSNGKDSILMFVDRMAKVTHFIPCFKSTTAPEFAQLFVSHIVRFHGLSDSITSDRGSIFTSNFWSIFTFILTIDLHKSTAFHLQTDGQTEHMNQTLETYLCSFCNYDQNN